MLWSILLMALREIRRNTMRSILTSLGIVIGVGAVIALVSVGQGATAKVTADVSKLGNNMLTLMPGAMRRGPPGGGGSAPPFKMADVNAVRRDITTVENVAPSSGSSALIVVGNNNYTTQITGTTNEYFAVRGYKLASGRQFSDAELAGGSPACVIGPTVRTKLFGKEDPLDQIMRVGKLPCRVVGLGETKGQSSMGQDQDDYVLMPLVVLQRRIAGNANISSIAMSVREGSSTDKAKSQITALMRERRRIGYGQEDNFSIMDMSEFSASMSSVTGALTALLAAIAGVSLLVGGIGIMNIMLVSVTERTREIGLRLAIGARGFEVLLQFLVEAIVLSTLGGVLGILFGLLGSYGATRALGFPFVVSPGIIVFAFGFSAMVGVAFGFFPARKAAQLNPIEALRHE
jgi:putative ABC transport system permease protein